MFEDHCSTCTLTLIAVFKSEIACSLQPSFWTFSVITEGFIRIKKYPAAIGTLVLRLPVERALEKPCRVKHLLSGND